MRSFEDILKEFEQFFKLENDKDNSSGRLKARDINLDLEIEFMEAIKGVTKQVQYSRNELSDASKEPNNRPGQETVYVRKTITESCVIPKGVYDGVTLRMAGKGNASTLGG